MKRILTISLSALTLAALALPVLAQGPGHMGGHMGGPGMEPGQRGQGMFKAMDKDGDGKVSEQEFMDAHRMRFERMDANKDGFLTNDEAGPRMGRRQMEKDAQPKQ